MDVKSIYWTKKVANSLNKQAKLHTSAFLNEIGHLGLKDGMLNTYRRICSDIQEIAEKQKIKCFSDDFACKCSAELLETLPECHRTTIKRIIRILGELAKTGQRILVLITASVADTMSRSVVLTSRKLDNDQFTVLLQDESIQIIF